MANIEELKELVVSQQLRIHALEKRVAELTAFEEFIKSPKQRTLNEPLPVRRDRIVAKVCSYYGLTFEQIIQRTRKTDVVFPRHMLTYLLRQEFNKIELDDKELGSLLGVDRSTVWHACKTISNFIAVGDEQAISDYAKLNQL